MAKLAFLIPNLQSGGVQKVITIVASAMVERGHDVTILVLGETGALASTLHPGAKIEILAKSNALASIWAGYRADPQAFWTLRPHLLAARNRSKTLDYLPALARYLKSAGLDTLFSATPYLNMDAALARQLAGASCRLIASERSHLSSGKQRKIWRAERLRGAMAYCYAKADLILAVSQGVAADLAATLGIDPVKIQTLHNPTVPDDADQRVAAPVDHPWFEDTAMPVMLAIGRPSYQKDYNMLLKAFAAVNAQRPVRLAIIGSTSDTKKRAKTLDHLQSLADGFGFGERLAFLGWQQDPFPYIARAQLLVLSSRWEGLPNVLLEALACGTPIVSTDCPSGPHEILAGGKFGELVPVGDHAAMAAAILAPLANPPAKAYLQERAKAFDKTSSLDGYEAILTGRPIKAD